MPVMIAISMGIQTLSGVGTLPADPCRSGSDTIAVPS
jgi:hypothetical protein